MGDCVAPYTPQKMQNELEDFREKNHFHVRLYLPRPRPRSLIGIVPTSALGFLGVHIARAFAEQAVWISILCFIILVVMKMM